MSATVPSPTVTDESHVDSTPTTTATSTSTSTTSTASSSPTPEVAPSNTPAGPPSTTCAAPPGAGTPAQPGGSGSGGVGGTRPEAGYQADVWYEPLKRWTFPTSFVPVSGDEARAVVHYFEAKHKGETYKLLPDDMNLIEGLRTRLATAFTAYGESGIFVKLASRSFKDSTLSSEAMRNEMRSMFHSRLEELKALPEDQLRNEKMIIFVRASVRSMKFTSADQVMELMKNSQRAFGDLLLSLMDEPFNMPLTLRRWDDRVIPETEVRVFIAGGKLTAATQYYPHLYCRFLHENNGVILGRLLSFFSSKISKVISLLDYTLDVACLPDKMLSSDATDEECFIVIEINPPPPRAGTSLFMEGSAHDQEILKHGPTQFRVNTSIPPNNLDEIQKELREFMDAIVPPPPAPPTPSPATLDIIKCTLC
ncbi:hypothetical protein Pelo_13494 [Pelomyxa schiedti]|nr:hypothetical protein Pelo_13494 [Pelomyxa schiedti]